jgi:hypothetical protein
MRAGTAAQRPLDAESPATSTINDRRLTPGPMVARRWQVFERDLVGVQLDDRSTRLQSHVTVTTMPDSRAKLPPDAGKC